MASCPHVAKADIHPPKPTDNVYREDCTICFDSSEDPAGLDVCLHCYNGGCAGDRHHSKLHAQHSNHPLAVNIKRTRKRKQRDENEPPGKISKLEIKAELDEDRYDTATDIKCLECGVDGLANDGKVGDVVKSVLKASTFAQQEEVKAWELELQPCEHTYLLDQEPAREIPSGDLGKCVHCDLKENLWLCLTCGSLGCGRRQYDGSGGNNHQVEHTKSTGHPVAVKLGSITAEGTADIWCYACDDEKKDPKLVDHLLHWGINIGDRVKTEKSQRELELEQNLKLDFSMTDAEGRQLKPLFGPELTGLKNLGNTCYLASVVQSLFSMPEFQDRYNRPNAAIPPISRPAEDIEIQLRKIADGLLSGRYSKPDSDVVPQTSDEKAYQRGLAPAMLKHLVGKGHAEFSTMRQQDAFELLLHVLKLVSRSQQSAAGLYDEVFDPVDSFRFYMEQKLQCLSCKKVRFRQDEMENISVAVPIKRLPKDPNAMDTNGDKDEKKEEFEPVTLKQCLDDFTAPEVVELTCSGCGNKGFTKQSLFKTFPQTLAVNARRFEIVNWVPTKQDVPVIVGDEEFDMEAYRSKGKQPGEEELSDDQDAGAGAAASNKFVPNETALEMLLGMGFPRVRCEKALNATGNSDAEVAAGWLFEHMDDPDIDTPLEAPAPAAGGRAVDPEKIEGLGNMGFSAPQARQALKETDGDMERAVDWLFSHPEAVGDFGDDAAPDGGAEAAAAVETVAEDTKPAKFALTSIVCHKGSSIHAGHYVAFIKKQEGWVLFNDEKVALGGDVDEMKKFAYIYFFRRAV
ncbi:Ubiquitin carboxyl-terminal hydrolase 14 [Fulvia fulva]|uniref:Ubiquitin carboxyl-terminal hydrolase n=1 Tax=Passalora fulva TaxID=5499 RepID=A0A9Q8UTQ5_PASFU|nr:Ubiquitin carboxyl-terminal hydrolase 14 [Fulvia fulva]KAK4614037.1 Ubiquitin carboxyl-terminal hydrolase 14 [Fulvia fulva]KAK4614756.1 Ubiquitin carboxyl-terminal hydrolase 14 [Fulvia fulva]UJO22121.1 Ubiquitin carboxyl-terminal hydrolase 14 [Fulvia fulva]WPV19868.1 Ubiquitin carboxyl-terminal hydrolase 14 [Fulvia fulva]WPV35580.1 Ubiquitin carboxyl-terminal hydrolase 14 [Fulvia fulva]